MEKLMSYLPVFAAVAGGWAIINGLLHDGFVLAKYGKNYNRELLRLLMDGHILITCGLIQLVAYIGLRENASWGIWMAGIATVSLLLYCAMIFPFLKSIGTILINTGLLLLLIILLVRH